MNKSFTSMAQVFPELERFILDENIENIHINPNGTVFIHRRGTEHDEEVGENLFGQEQLLQILRVLSQQFTGEEIHAVNPSLYIDFKDGSNLTATIPPMSDGVMITMSRTPVPEWVSAETLREERWREQETRRQEMERQIEQEWEQLRTQAQPWTQTQERDTENAREAKRQIRKSWERLREWAKQNNNAKLVQQLEDLRE